MQRVQEAILHLIAHSKAHSVSPINPFNDSCSSQVSSVSADLHSLTLKDKVPPECLIVSLHTFESKIIHTSGQF